MASPRSAIVLTGLLALVGVPGVAIAREAELCAEGTGMPQQDVLVCTRALILSTLPPPSLATLHNSRGRALQMIGEPGEAVKAHDAALAANPLSVEARLGRALARLDLGSADEASLDVRDALELNPHHGAAWRLQGRLRFLAGDDSGAEQALDRALQLNPADAEAHAFRGFARYRQRQYAEALTAFRAARANRLGYIYLPLWEWLAARGAGIRSEAAVETALQGIEPGQWPAALLRVYLTSDDGSALEALLRGDPLQGTDTRVAEVAFYLGERDRHLGNPALARQRLERAALLAAPMSVERSMAVD